MLHPCNIGLKFKSYNFVDALLPWKPPSKPKAHKSPLTNYINKVFNRIPFKPDTVEVWNGEVRDKTDNQRGLKRRFHIQRRYF